MKRVVAISVTFVLFVYLSTAICGYLLFGNQTCGDILTNFNESYNLAIIGRTALCCLIICTFPFACFSIRNSFIALAWEGRYDMESLPTSYHVSLAVGVETSVCVSMSHICLDIEIFRKNL